ncbi:UNKNOWN [Stylonychia lemnae]|uniref:DIX domain-containing protein n=1 Tax=Stylonychia lemnae TaxID=5949 RepID=A0A078A7Q0_STYLE|nr:UNKNOWN [Stylonychia lemnae]|eukprot:CDW78285.1 UNKNOWN [Stylonychia lemnae]
MSQQQANQQQQQQAAKPFTLVFYYVPEDKDDLAVPNAYAIPKNVTDITLADIEKHFPLEGDFHFRFKYKYNNQSVWLDLNNKQCKVPKVENKIIMKVSRKTAKNRNYKND